MRNFALHRSGNKISTTIGYQTPMHYTNTPMQYTAIFHGCKNGNFKMKNCDIFLIFAQNIDRGYAFELPH